MGTPVVKSTNGYGVPVTVVSQGGAPIEVASNGFGTPIIEVASGGLPVTYVGGNMPTTPAAFTSGQWSVADAAVGGRATVTISALPGDGGSAITAIQYQVGAGAWTASGISSTGSFNINGLTNDTPANIKVRAFNAVGNGPDSDTKSVTPTAGYEPESVTWFNAMTPAADDTRKGLLNTLMQAWKSSTWPISDLLYLPAAHAQQVMNLNARNPNGPNSLVPMNGPIAVIDKGYTSDGIAAYLGTNYIFTAVGNLFTQDGASLRFYINGTFNDGQNNDPVIGMDTTAGTLTFVRPRDGTGGMGARINATTNDNSASVGGTRIGYKAVVRINSNQYQFYGSDGLPLGGPVTRASAAMQVKELLFLRLGTGYGRDNLAFMGVGGMATAAMIKTERDAVVAYLTAIGAN